MGKFEDRLIGELLDEHGPALAVLERPEPVRRSHRPLWISGGALAAAVTAAAVFTLAGGGGSAAYAVTQNPNGTVTVTLADMTGVAGANEQLRRLGVPMRLLQVEKYCHEVFHPDPAPVGIEHASHQPFGLTVQVAKIPHGETLVIGAEVTSIRTGSGTESIFGMVAEGLVKGALPTCAPYSLDIPGAR